MSRRPECDFRDDVCQPFYLEGTLSGGCTHGVLLIHGFTGTVAHLRPIAEALHREGFTVMGINLPGHACTMDEMAACTWLEWLNAAKDAFWRLKEKCDHVSVVGLSMGGCLALILGEQMHPTAIAPISAPMGTQLPLWLATLVRPVVPTIWWKPHRAAVSPVDKRYDYGYSGFRSSSARHLSRLIRMSRRDLHAVTCPVLVVQSHADDAITPESAEVILRGVSSQRKGTLWLEDVPHVCTITREAGHIAAALSEHFRRAERG